MVSMSYPWRKPDGIRPIRTKTRGHRMLIMFDGYLFEYSVWFVALGDA